MYGRKLPVLYGELKSSETPDSGLLNGAVVFISMVLSFIVGNYLPVPPSVTGIAVLVMFMCLFVFFTWIFKMVENSIEPDFGVPTGAAFFIALALSLFLGNHLAEPSEIMGIEVPVLFLCFFVLFGVFFNFVELLWPDNYSPGM